MTTADSLKKIVRSDNLPPGRDWKYFRERSHNLFFLCTVILKSAWEDKFNNFGRLQKAMCAFLDPGMNENRRLFMSVFRGSYKSTILLGLCLLLFCWSVATGEPISIVYNTATKDNAELFMAFFRRTLIECDLLHWVFPELPPKDRTDLYRSFTQTMVECKNAVFHVSSIETQQTGRHYTVIINDDLVTKDNAFSEVGRAAVRRAWSFQKAILTKHKRLGIGTEIDVGTLYHENDLIAYLINEAKGYDKFIVPYSIRTASGREVLSFPEMFTWEDFEDRLADMGETDFSTQYKLLIHGGSNCLIRREKLKYWSVLPLNYTRYMFIDPAGTEKEKNDPWGFLVWDLDDRGYLHVRYCEEAWHDIRNGLRHADRLSQLWNPDEIWFEKEKYSIAAEAVAADIVPHLVFQLHDHKNEPPDSRVRRLKPYLETGKILFGEGQEALLKQVLRFPDTKPHDDLLMCLAHSIRVGQAPKKGPAKEPSTPAEKDFHDEMMDAYKRMSAIRGGSDQEIADSLF